MSKILRFVAVCCAFLCVNAYADNPNLVSELLKRLSERISSSQDTTDSGNDGTGTGTSVGTGTGTGTSTTIGTTTGTTTVGNVISTVTSTINNTISNMSGTASNAVSNFTSNISTGISSITNNASLLGKKLVSTAKTTVTNQNQNIQSAVESIFNGIKAGLSNLSSKMGGYDVSVSYEGNNVVSTTDPDLANLKAALTDQVDKLKETVGEKLSGALNNINTLNSPLLDTLKNSLNNCITAFVTNSGSSEATSLINSAVQEFVSCSNTMIDNMINVSAGDVASALAGVTELKEQAQKLLEEKIATMTSIGVSAEEIEKIKNIYNDTIGNTLSKISVGDYAGATAALTTKKEELKEYLGTAASNLVNTVEEAKNNLTNQLLESTGLSETEVGKAVEEIASSINVGSMAEKLTNGDTESLKEDVSEALNKVKEIASEKAESIVSNVNENLTNKILEATGMKDNSVVSSMLSSAVSSLNLGGIASSLFSGGLSAAKEAVASTVTNIKDSLTQENIQNKVSELLTGTNATEQLKNSIKSFGDTVKNSINNTALGMTAAGTALNDIIDSAVTAGNEEAITAVNKILCGDTEGGLQDLKNSGINLADNSIATSIQIAESLLNKGLQNTDFEVSIDKKTDNDDVTTASAADSEQGLQDYVDNLGSDTAREEEEVNHNITEEELAERESYNFHESSMMSEAEMAHREAAHHNAKNASSGSSTTTN